MSSLFTSVAWPKARSPKRSELLDALAQLLPWSEIEATLRPLLPPPAKTGRPANPLPVMVRAVVLQWLFQLSDEAVECTILDSHAAARFVGVDPWKPRPPGASAIRNFRRLVTEPKGRHAPSACESVEGFIYAVPKSPQVPTAWESVECLMYAALAEARVDLRRGVIVEPQLRRRPGPKGGGANL